MIIRTPPPPPPARHVARTVAHRGRVVTYVCVATSPADRSTLVAMLAEMLRQAPP